MLRGSCVLCMLRLHKQGSRCPTLGSTEGSAKDIKHSSSTIAVLPFPILPAAKGCKTQQAAMATSPRLAFSQPAVMTLSILLITARPRPREGHRRGAHFLSYCLAALRLPFAIIRIARYVDEKWLSIFI